MKNTFLTGMVCKMLSKDKIEALSAKGDTIVEANAGTGKTRLIVEKVISLIEAGYKVDEIVLITFTEAAAGELKERVKNRIYEEVKKGKKQFKQAILFLPSAPISTIHAFCYDILKRFGFRYGYFDIDCEMLTEIEAENLLEESIFSIIVETDPEFLRKIIKRISSDYIAGLNTLINFIKETIKHRTRYAVFQENFSAESMFKRVEKLFFKLQTGDFPITKEISQKYKIEKNLVEDVLSILIRCYQAYEHIKKEKKKVGYNDLLELTYKMLVENDNAREEVASLFKYIIVDEFQDTDPFQWKILKLLKETTSPPTIFIVGDPKQSIYRFRSADVSIWNEASKYVKNRCFLTENFRSGKNLLLFFNDVFDSIYNKSEKKLGVELSFHPFEGNIQGGEILAVEFEKDEEFAEKALRLTIDRSRKKKIAVIGRSRSSLAVFEKILREKGIVFSVIGSNPFSTTGIEEVLHLLKWLKDREDLKSFFFFLSSRFCGLNHYEALSFIKDGTTGCGEKDIHIKELLNKVEEVRNQKDKELHAILINRLLEITGFIDMLSVLDRESYFSVLELIKEIANFEMENAVPFDSMVDFVEELKNSRNNNINISQEGESGYFLMTIHGSKGLQFDDVILLPWKRPPSNHTFRFTSTGFGIKLFYEKKGKITPKDEFEASPFFFMLKKVDEYLDELESKNLVYVSMTRAVERLILGIKLKKRNRQFPYGKNLDHLIPIVEKYKITGLPEPEKLPEEEPLFSVIPEREVKTVKVIYPSSNNTEILSAEETETKSAAPEGMSPAEYGTVVHLLCEAFIKKAPKEKAINFAISHLIKPPLSLKEKLEAIYDFLNEKFPQLQNGKAEVDVKHYADYTFYSGRIDILLETENGIEIWDIKTGFFKESLFQHYREQLYFYKKILEAAGKKVSSMKLLYVDEKRIIEVE
ncbi:UvrD-helicase domain-containing protein [Desulfurobacterium sp. TC5-1]|uniref:UvrD-helicase domain-containing protein n=1 Tax=Desulfurobacterium sp. TC5-1 TaxID=1158318 RepID=UPI0003B6B436|nr:UvrD-helicase domain-containing protein [Desulfurobacterium sp. TC5-1]